MVAAYLAAHTIVVELHRVYAADQYDLIAHTSHSLNGPVEMLVRPRLQMGVSESL